MLTVPASITLVSADQMNEIAALTAGVVVTDDDDLG